ncbi:TetR/AcrR family transcriptional regulator [Pseudosulfitobacter koreensis]|uniref:TetR family transcriptional regulator n=1 Tax=Pseudosulfitobacter koreensis TaxID=2968472 RepID=A0ABT1Z450_9RHOB|nr:TetR/AcrR family transcriptional regulator [Pseudosulfitobacter koreense]MCR8827906.1 TetR family transcriptional regulator [Pseudosulfitobacter koreense]
MAVTQTPETKRQRAPSKRALATKLRVLDAAEKVFAEQGFDGATIRRIASEAGEPVGTIHHHGGGKIALFHQTVARRADTLSRDRLESLARVLTDGDPTLEQVLAAFMCPFFDLSAQDPRWRDYARLVAFVSADVRWRDISAECFDPVADVFLQEITRLLPDKTRKQIAEGFVFSVSAMLALLTSQDRMGALAAATDADGTEVAHLIRFCAAGLRA